MKITVALIVICGMAPLQFAATARAQSPSAADPTATVSENETSFTIGNGTIVARISKRNGDLTSLQYKGIETLESNSGHAGGYWSHDVVGGTEIVTKITVDPKANGGDRAEVSVKGISGGKLMGHGPGAGAGGNFPADIEIRYSIGRGDSGVYTYCTFTHLPEYPAGSMTEARYCAKLAEMFNWMTIDAKRSMLYPKDLHEGDKYIYTAVQFDHLVYGWCSTTKNLGFWLINPSAEYLSGGPTKVEFLCHRDTTPVAAACIHNYWRSSHYGGALVEVAKDETWTKVVGPFFLYVNAGADPQAMLNDATAQLKKESQHWPYEWVAGVDYPRRAERATVAGQLIVKDPQMPDAKTPNLMVGLTHPAYSTARPGGPGGPRLIDWQIDAKHYEFWVPGASDGRFSIPQVRPGTYTLHAFADGVLGEFTKTDVKVEGGKPMDLGKLEWQPVRRGKQLWEIGIPNRNGSEFFKAEEFADPEVSLKYAQLFPNDVNFIVGKSDFRRDWYFQHVPHNVNPNAKAEPFFGVRSSGKETPFSISFDMPDAPSGKATLRVAISGTGARSIGVTVNDTSVGQIERLTGDGAIMRHSIQGLWYERELLFDAKAMKQGNNVLKLIVPAGPINNGVIYDYVRLELDEADSP